MRAQFHKTIHDLRTHQAAISKVHPRTTRLGETRRRARRRRQRHKRLRVSGIRGPVRAVVGDILGRAVRQFEVLQRATEHLERCGGLVVGHLVAGLVHAEEGEVAELSHFAVLLLVHHEGLIPGGSELGGVGVV